MSWAAIPGWRPSRIGLRLLAFNLLVVFVPVVGVLYLNVYETRLLRAQEESMVQQGRVLAAALADAAVLDADSVGRLLARLEPRGDARYRVYDTRGVLLGDSARGRAAVGGEPITRYEASPSPLDVRDRVLYRIGAWLANSRKTVRSGSFVPRATRPASNRQVPSLKCRLLLPAGTDRRPGPRPDSDR